MMRLRDRLHNEGGALSAEFVAIAPILLAIAAIAWQTLIIVGAGTSTATAARNGSRALSTDEHPCAVVERSLPRWLREDHEVRLFGRGTDGPVDVTPLACQGDAEPELTCLRGDDTRTECSGVQVEVRVPVLFPGLTVERFRLARDAELPTSR